MGKREVVGEKMTELRERFSVNLAKVALAMGGVAVLASGCSGSETGKEVQGASASTEQVEDSATATTVEATATPAVELPTATAEPTSGPTPAPTAKISSTPTPGINPETDSSPEDRLDVNKLEETGYELTGGPGFENFKAGGSGCENPEEGLYISQEEWAPVYCSDGTSAPNQPMTFEEIRAILNSDQDAKQLDDDPALSAAEIEKFLEEHGMTATINAERNLVLLNGRDEEAGGTFGGLLFPDGEISQYLLSKPE